MPSSCEEGGGGGDDVGVDAGVVGNGSHLQFIAGDISATVVGRLLP